MLQGSIKYSDFCGNVGTVTPGDVQVSQNLKAIILEGGGIGTSTNMADTLRGKCRIYQPTVKSAASNV